MCEGMCVHAKYTCKSQRRISGIFLYYMPPYSLAAVSSHGTWAGNFRHPPHTTLAFWPWLLTWVQGITLKSVQEALSLAEPSPWKSLAFIQMCTQYQKTTGCICSSERLPCTVLQGTVGRKAAVHLIGQCEDQGLRKASADRSVWQSRQSDTS